MKTGVIGRIASALLVGVLWLGIGGVGVVSAANSPGTIEGARIDVVVNVSENTHITPGTAFTDIIVLTNNGAHPANDLTLSLPYDGSLLRLMDVKINQEDAWVTQATPGSFKVSLGRLSSNGESVAITAHFMALPGYKADTPISSKLETTWVDRNGSHKNTTDTLLLFTESGMTAPVVRAAPVTVVNGAVPVYSSAFLPGESVTFWYNAPNGSVVKLYVYNNHLTTERRHEEKVGSVVVERLDNSQYMVADSSGAVSTTFPVAGLASGKYSIVLRGVTNGRQTVIPFTIN